MCTGADESMEFTYMTQSGGQFYGFSRRLTACVHRLVTLDCRLVAPPKNRTNVSVEHGCRKKARHL